MILIKPKLTKIFLLLLCLLFFTGCLLYKKIHYAGMEPYVRPMKDQPYEVVGEAEAKISNYSLLWAITVTKLPDFDSALMEMASEKGGDDVIDIRYWQEKQHWLVGTVTIIHIRGKVIRYTSDK